MRPCRSFDVDWRLEKYKVVGVSTDIGFLRSLAGNKVFIQGDVETGFIKVIPVEHLPECEYLRAESRNTL